MITTFKKISDWVKTMVNGKWSVTDIKAFLHCHTVMSLTWYWGLSISSSLTANRWQSGNALGSFMLWSICWLVGLKETLTSLAQMTLSGDSAELLELYFGSFRSQLPGLKWELAGNEYGKQRAPQKILRFRGLWLCLHDSTTTKG